MRAVIQRVSRASVTINKKMKSEIGPGFLFLPELRNLMMIVILNGYAIRLYSSVFLMTAMK